MPFLRAVNLPLPLIIQSVTAVGLGLHLALFRKPLYINIKNGYSLLAPSNPPPRTADTVSLLGIVITGLEVCYLVSSYMPIEENQFIAASIPVRIGLSILMGAVCIVHRKSMSNSGLLELVTLAVLDSGAALGLGIYLGRWDGMVKGAEKWVSTIL